MSTIGTTNTPSFIKIQEVILQFLGDLTWDDPWAEAMYNLTAKFMPVTLV